MGSSSTPSAAMGFGAFLLLFIVTGALTTLFVGAYSGIGYGLEVLKSSYDYHDEAAIVLRCLGGTLVVLWLTDVHRWPMLLREVLAFCAFAALSVALLLMVSETPFGPLCVFTLLMPMLLVLVKYTMFHNVPASVYTVWIYRVLVTQGFVLAGIFFYWATRGENMWDSPTRAYYSDRVGCEINYHELDECKDDSTGDDVPCFWKTTNKREVEFSSICTVHCIDVYEDCEEAFITWVNPFLGALCLLVTGFVAKYLKPDDPQSFHHVSAVVRFVAVFLFLLWIFASMAGAGDGLSNSLIAFAVCMVIGSGIVTSALFWKAVQDEAVKDVEQVAQSTKTYTDVLKGLLILAALPLIFVYLVLSVLNQCIRRILMMCCGGCVKYTDEEKNHQGMFTKAVSDQLKDFTTWDHSKVFTYAVYWGFGYIGFNVLASKFTTLFLSWLIEFTSSMSVTVVTAIVVGVGMFMFLLPPIPGVPIYLTAGIVLVSVGETSMGLWGSIAYASAVSLAIKLLGSLMQQKMIGEVFGKSVNVRQMVGINSEGIRAMRVVLSDPKFTMNKVFVLVGGPDWPVSVLCGILGLDTLPILLGTLPVMVIVVPVVFCGSFAFMGSMEDENGLDTYPWADTMAAVASALVAGGMFCFTMGAAAAVKDTLENKKAEMDAIPVDEEVKQADDITEREAKAYTKAVVWSNVPIWAKLSLILAVLCMINACAMLVGFNTKCFTEYDLMYTISEHLGGKWYNLVKPLGRYAMSLALIAYFFLSIFQGWASRETKRVLQQSEFVPLVAGETTTYA